MSGNSVTVNSAIIELCQCGSKYIREGGSMVKVMAAATGFCGLALCGMYVYNLLQEKRMEIMAEELRRKDEELNKLIAEKMQIEELRFKEKKQIEEQRLKEKKQMEDEKRKLEQQHLSEKHFWIKEKKTINECHLEEIKACHQRTAHLEGLNLAWNQKY